MKIEEYKYKKSEGITVISLIITIILLIILAGITINLSLGENGLFTKGKQAKEKYNETASKEKLEMVLAEAQIEKETNIGYNSEDFLDSILTGQDIFVNGNTVIVNNYNFLIDREELKIVETLGETSVKVINEVKEYLGKGENDIYRVSSLITIESNIEIESIKITKPDGTDITLTTNKQTIATDIEMEFDQEYEIEIKTMNGKTDKRKIIEKSEDKIRTVEDLMEFRNKVNIGLTYEGKTMILVNDLDLSNVCGANINGKEISWEPIGNYGTDETHVFKGTFNGNNHTISNLYINTINNFQGLFGHVQNGKIIGVIIGNSSSIQNDSETVDIKGGSYIGAIAGFISDSSIVSNCGNNVNVMSLKTTVGGIVGASSNNSKIICTYNKGNITGNSHTAGGIVGQIVNGELAYSYNTGNVQGNYIVGGVAGETYNSKANNCYNKGTIKNNGGYVSYVHLGGVIGSISRGCTTEFLYNLGIVENNGGGNRTGGITGICTNYGGNPSRMTHCYNSERVISNNSVYGGICGLLDNKCTINDSYNLVGVSIGGIKTELNNTTGLIGSSLGSINRIGILENMPTVYNVVNGLDDGDSQYWQKNDLNLPKLKWEPK